MDKKESFKNFARSHPELVRSIKTGDSSWQKLYEIYDIYGEDENAWRTYLKPAETVTNPSFSSISNMVKNIDMDSVQKHINTAQKALNLVQELTTKTPSTTLSKGPAIPRPINHFFED